MDNTIFNRGKYKEKTYKYVRINDPSYFLWLIEQPVKKVYNYLDFIKYCMGYTKIKDEDKIAYV